MAELRRRALPRPDQAEARKAAPMSRHRLMRKLEHRLAYLHVNETVVPGR
jgi:hypothetical protein